MLSVGMGGANEDCFRNGAAYTFHYHKGSFIVQLRLTPPKDVGFGNFFGAHVAVHSDTYLILAPIEFGNAIYVYRIGERP